jgi:hypothetical protein
MGMQDRDWYREDHAKKNGMGYNAANGTYYDPKLYRGTKTQNVHLPAEPLVVQSGKKWHPFLTVFLTAWLCLLVYAALKLIAHFS